MKKFQKKELLEKYISLSKGVLHLGAHEGQEADQYSKFNKPVIWVEAIPHVFERLIENLKSYPDQKGYSALLTNKDGYKINFNISSNVKGVSSSIFNFGPYSEGEKSLWPKHNLTMVDKIELTSTRLDTLINSNNISIKDYNFWIVDLQGAELLALHGAGEYISQCDMMYVEVSTDTVYENGVLWPELSEFIISKGFTPLYEPSKIHDDVLFVRKK